MKNLVIGYKVAIWIEKIEKTKISIFLTIGKRQLPIAVYVSTVLHTATLGNQLLNENEKFKCQNECL